MKVREIKSGVHIGVAHSTKYKTNQMIVKFILPYDVKTAAQLAILSRMMEDGSQTIPSRSVLEQHLADLYGASLSLTSQRKGKFQEFTLSTTCVRPELVNQADLIEKWCQLVDELLFHQSFDEQQEAMRIRFEREKQSLIRRIQRQQDDKKRLVSIKLYDHIYQHDLEAAAGGAGRLEILEEVTYEDVAAAYMKLLEQSAIYIAVQGELAEDYLANWAQTLPLAARQQVVNYKYNVLPLPPQEYQLVTESVTGLQTNVALAYRIPSPDTLRERLTLQLATALFVSLPTSQLFTEIREKQSLAYMIQSESDISRSLVTIRLGISPEQLEHVLQEIAHQLQLLADTLSDNQSFAEAKLTFLSTDIQSRDFQYIELGYYIGEQLHKELDLSAEAFQYEIEQIKASEVAACLKQWVLVAAYALIGGKV